MYMPILSVTFISWDTNKARPCCPHVDLIVLPQKSFVEALTPNAIEFGNRVFKDIIKVKWSYKGEALNP